MTEPSRVRVYVAASLDGFLAGPEDDLSWLPGPVAEDPTPVPGEQAPETGGGPGVGFADFLRDVGALLMGRRTYDVVTGFEAWPYGALPVLVATHRPLGGVRPGVRAVAGDIASLVAQARAAAAGRDVYLDGGALIRQALDAGLVDEAIVTLVPVLLGHGRPLFAGVARRHHWVFTSHTAFPGGLVQLRCRPALP